MKFIVIGISDAPEPFFTPEIQEIIKNGQVFSGGKRHHEIVAPLLPTDAQWIDITTPLDAVFEQYQSLTSDVIVFASGDPLFFGFANTIRRKMPEAEIVLYPTFTGRPWPEFDKALIERTTKIGILTDKEHTPAAIAQRMIDYGYTNYQMHVGEHLGNPSLEHVTTLSLEEASQRDFSNPNCLIIEQQGEMPIKPFGIPDADFTLLDGREKMITKMPIRLLTLQVLELRKKNVFWDIGFCTGTSRYVQSARRLSKKTPASLVPQASTSISAIS